MRKNYYKGLNMVEYNVRDVWFGINEFKNNFIMFSVIAFIIAIICFFLKYDFLLIKYSFISFEIILFIQSLIIYFKSSTYKIDKDGNFTFPRSDVENSFFEILIQSPYWNLMRSRTIHISEIESVYVNNEFGFALDVTGTFGSARLDFSSKQKRSEIRNAINRTAKRYNNNFVDNSVNVNM